ncbi:hypothetical protein OBBRIDRAFT_836360 [Obba rivulosa]|uniref:Uncharacterized protein n=1 Tax=Obba rivulosa TaxID=1052685 RepID=A0A8E2DHX7_9APHY|nr:hypothetical protein OBBRIDRAFT_836360 [Obba rivulosa]
MSTPAIILLLLGSDATRSTSDDTSPAKKPRGPNKETVNGKPNTAVPSGNGERKEIQPAPATTPILAMHTLTVDSDASSLRQLFDLAKDFGMHMLKLEIPKLCVIVLEAILSALSHGAAKMSVGSIKHASKPPSRPSRGLNCTAHPY